jgi:hypothetical protein
MSEVIMPSNRGKSNGMHSTGNGHRTIPRVKLIPTEPEVSPYIREAIKRARERDARRSWWQKLVDGDLFRSR